MQFHVTVFTATKHTKSDTAPQHDEKKNESKLNQEEKTTIVTSLM